MSVYTYSTAMDPAMFFESPVPNNPTAPPTRPAPGTVLRVRDYVGYLANVAAGQSTTTASANATVTTTPGTLSLAGEGYVPVFTCTAACVQLSADAGATWYGPFWGAEAKADVASNLLGSTQAGRSLLKALDTPTIVGMLNAVTGDQLGAQNGPARLDAAGQLTTAQMPSAVQQLLTSTTVPLSQSSRASFYAAAIGASPATLAPMSAGATVGPYTVLEDCHFSWSPAISLPDSAAVDAATVTLLAQRPGDSGFSDCYTATARPTLTAGQLQSTVTNTRGAAGFPDKPNLPAGSLWAVRLFTAPTPPSGVNNTTATASPLPAYTSGAASRTTHQLYTTTAGGVPVAAPGTPPGGVGDTVLLVVATAGGVPAAPDGSYRTLIGQADSGNAKAQLYVMVAPWTSTISTTVTLPAAGVASGQVVVLHGTDAANILPLTAGGGYQLGAGPVSGSSLGATSRGYDLRLDFFAAAYAATADNYTLTLGSLPAGASVVGNVVTTRTTPTDVTDVGLGVVTSGALSSGAAVPAVTATPNAGAPGATGPLTNTSWAWGTILVPRPGSAVPGPSRVDVQTFVAGGLLVP